PRETEVLTLVARGYSNAEVAGLLGMSANTVTTHTKNIYRKLAVRSRSEAVFEAAQLGLIRLADG
ncbi:MAG: LuxR C-terminal-related transcriptional regulator, partial [Pseudomonadota bacterium]